jgi:large subunit ribosomal protein L18
MVANKESRRARIKMSIRKNISGTADSPRMSVFRSNKAIYVQIIDDVTGKTLVSASSTDKGFDAQGNKKETAQALGKVVAEKASTAGIASVVFDRNGYLYHGRVKALAEGAREGGLKF